MNTEAFTGKAQAYTNARPGYPDEAIEYICSLVKPDAVFADVGAGTGKFTSLIAQRGYEIFAVEPNADMREQLAITLAPFPNAKIVNGTAETTTIPSNSVDVITCAQAIGWFDLDAFRNECCRVGKREIIVVSLYNESPGDNHVPASHRLTSKQATDIFFNNPIVREFPNPIFYTRERWIQHNASISDNPQSSDDSYDIHTAKMNEIFDRDSVDGLLRIDLITKVYSGFEREEK